ncbi:MAG: YhbY family RNA-binding protein [Methanosarcinales archaeon]|nr:YhbY family RNA-binding protein [ANME-2 cluster archaeon]MDF1530878.1 YhbY family RNA-binding protein [ANME-2 cluster archaeon]MDW7776184.1 YhbY family RNA-binding protein [Methanosarcinales archaeon]
MNLTTYELKRGAVHLSPLLNVGKNGITDSLVEELLNQLKQNKLVKIKILKSAAVGSTDRMALAEELSRRTGTQLVEVRGSNAVLYQKRGRK